MNICIVIPIFNEAEHIGALVDELQKRNFNMVVVNDGSTDQSAEILKNKNVSSVHHQVRSGKGMSLRDGFYYAVEHRFDGVIAMDGDGQHAVDDIAVFLEKAKIDKDCVIVGSRLHHAKNMPMVRFLTNKFMSSLISNVCKQRVEDSQCGFRYIGCGVLKTVHLKSSNYEIESEVLIKASRKGFKIYSVPVQTIYRDEKSKIRPLRDTVRFFRYLWRELRNPEG